ncbi:MAG: hypothetical protein ABI537_14785 [Casimicrobiaceae bacterium]
MIAAKHRRFVTLLFALLLLGMQHQLQVHALQHLDSVLHARHDTGLQAPVADASCLECALLAAGTSAIPGGHSSTPALAPVGERQHVATAARRLAAPSYYSSRAPPSLL